MARFCALGLVLGLLLLAHEARAEGSLRVLVRVVSGTDRALLPRLYGQLSDVDVQLMERDVPPLEATFALQLEAARALAAQHALDAVLWFAPAQGETAGVVMHLATPATERVLTRRLLAANGAANKPASSLLETAALAARSALTALRAGAAVGVPVEQALQAAAGEGTCDAAHAAAGQCKSPVDGQGCAADGACVARREGDTRVRGATWVPRSQQQPSAARAETAADRGVLRSAPASGNTTEASGTAAAAVRGSEASSAGGGAESERASATSRSDGAPRGPSPSARELAPPTAASEPVARTGRDAAATASARVDRSPEEADERASTAPLALGIQVFMGLQGALDGRSSMGQHSLYARAGIKLGSIVLSGYGAASLASTIDDPYFRLRVARHAVGVSLELQSVLGDATQLGVGVHGGAALLERSSEPKTSDVVSYPASLTAAWAFGPELALRWVFGHYGLGLRFALDILPSAPRFETAPTSQTSGISHELWALQPRLALGMEAALP